MNHFSELQSQHEKLLRQEAAKRDILDKVQAYIETVRFESRNVSSPQDREQLRANVRYWASYVYAQTEQFPNVELSPFSGEMPPAPSTGVPRGMVAAGIIIALLFILLLLLMPGLGSSDASEDSVTAVQTMVAALDATDVAVVETIVTTRVIIDGTGTPTIPWSPTPDAMITSTPNALLPLRRITAENANRLQPITTLFYTTAVLDLDFSPDGQQLASSAADGSAALWDMNNFDAPPWVLAVNQTGWMQAITFNADGNLLAMGGNDRIVRVIDVDGYPFAEFAGHDGFVFGLSYTPDGTQLASGDGGGVLNVWDIRSGGLLSTNQIGASAIVELDFNQVQNRLAVANAEDGFKLLDYPSLRPVCSFERATVLTTAFAKNGRFIVLGDDAGNIRQIDAEKCSELMVTAVHNGNVNSVAVSEDDSLIISGGQDGAVAIMPGNITVFAQTDSIESVAINPQGTLIASASADGTIVLWGILE